VASTIRPLQSIDAVPQTDQRSEGWAS
jgi:hypothetical protein